MPTMQEYLEEMARRQATGWTPGVPTRYTGALPTSYPAFSNLSALWAGAQPKANLGDIAAASADPAKKKGVGRPKLTAEEIQRSSARAGTGVVKSIAPMLSAISKVAGPIGAASYAYDALRPSQLASAAEATANPGTDFRVTQAYPSMAVEEGYPNVSTLPSFDVTPDAGGAVGGYPTMDADYGTMATEEFDYVPSVPSDPTGGMIDADALAGMFDVGPMSMAQVGTNAFGIPDKSYGPVTVTETSMRNADQLHSNVDAMINKLGNTGALSGTAQDYGYSHPFQTAWYDHPYMDSDDAMFSQGMKQMQDYQDYGPFSALGYSAGQPIDELSKALGLRGSLQPASIAGTVAQMAFPMAGVQQDNIPALVDDIVERNVLNPYGFENPLATSALANPNITAMNTFAEDFDELAFGAFGTKHVPGTSVPVTPPDSMLMQDFIDKYGPVQSGTRDAYYHRDGTVRNSAGDIVSTPDATYNEYAGMGQVASHPGQGGYIGDTERTIGEHLAAVDERVQAMPAVTTSQALSTQDERQQAMPTEVTKTKGPTKASVAAQARLAQQQADAAMRRAAQKAAAQDAARLAAQRAAVQADIAAAQAEQDRIRQANALMNSKSYQESGLDGLSPAERDIVAAAQVDTFAGIERQIRGDSDTAGERSAGMGGGRGGFAGPDRW